MPGRHMTYSEVLQQRNVEEINVHLSTTTSEAAAPKVSGRGRSQSVQAITTAWGCFEPEVGMCLTSMLFLRLRACNRR